MSGTIPHSMLGKHWNAFSHHHVHEAITGGWLHFEHIPGTGNPADVLMKPSPWLIFKIFVKPLLPWKGNMVDVPSSTSHPEGSDVGPGSTVLDGQLSQEQNSAHMIWHAILAIPHSNQCAVLCDAMPTDIEFLNDMWSVTTFDFTQIWTDSPT